MRRRDFLRMLGAGAAIGLAPPALAACLRRSDEIEIPAPFRKMEEASHERLGVFQGASEFLEGPNRIPLALADEENRTLLGAKGRLWAGRDDDLMGPVPLDYRSFSSPAEHVHDPDNPKVFDAGGFYDAEIDMPTAGFYHLMANASHEGRRYSGFAAIEVADETNSPKSGEKAPPVATPTFEEPRGVAAVCTREPPCPFHRTSLDGALGRTPLVLVVATPALCTSRVCGPVVDELIATADRIDGIGFIHAEVFEDLSGQDYAPIMLRWSLPSEPWVFLIDSIGVVRARFEGPVTSGQVTAAIGEVLR